MSDSTHHRQITIQNLNNELKTIFIITAITLTIALAFTMGPAFLSFLYFCCAIAGGVGYALYPDHCDKILNQHQGVLLGAALGFFSCGPIGLILGAWLMHFILKKIDAISQTAQQVSQAASIITTPITYSQSLINKASQTISNCWQYFYSSKEQNTQESSDEEKSEENESSENQDSEPSLDKSSEAEDHKAIPSSSAANYFPPLQNLFAGSNFLTHLFTSKQKPDQASEKEIEPKMFLNLEEESSSSSDDEEEFFDCLDHFEGEEELPSNSKVKIT